MEGNGSLWGSIVNYGNSGVAHEGPAVAALPNDKSDKTYLIVWIDDLGPAGFGCTQAYINQAGILRGGWGYVLPTDIIAHITVAANKKNNTYLIGLQFDQGTKDKSISLSLEDCEGIHLDNFVIPGPAYDFPAIAAGPSGSYLTAWQGQPLSITHTNIYGRIIQSQSLSYLPLIKR